MAKDINANWRSKQDPVILYDESAVHQAIYNILFFNRNECFFGEGNEVNISSELFELIPFDGDTLTIRSLSDRITAFNPKLKLIESKSSVRAVGDQFQLHLVIEYDYAKSVTIDQRVQAVM